jgi:acyl-CoA synthetase (AMP-forming)/AMP-acid ligase II
MSIAADCSLNVADRLDEMARLIPQSIAIAEPTRRVKNGRRLYRTVTFEKLASDVESIACGLVANGVTPGMRLALLVPPGIDFITLVFALLKSGAVQILIDPGMGGKNLLRSVAEAQPEGFIAIPRALAAVSILRRRFPHGRLYVTVGRRLWWGGMTLNDLRRQSHDYVTRLPQTIATDPAAIIFTTGSTGPAKGVLYQHGNFDRQVTEIRDHYRIEPGEIDVPCFALFGLFNAAMGVTTVLPRMNFSRPATVDPRNIVEAVQQWHATQSFASPTVWQHVGPYCQRHGIRLNTLRRVMSAGAPVPAHVLESMKQVINPRGDVHTPYGATEALPVASISASEVLSQTRRLTDLGKGVCVGRRYPGIDWRVIRIVDGPIRTIEDTQELPSGEIGELIVCGPVVTSEYVTRRESNDLAKIHDSNVREPAETLWHRMGDSGYLDSQDRFWFCGRVAHRVTTANGELYSIPCEAIFNRHPRVSRSALVGVGRHGEQTPAIVIEPMRGEFPRSHTNRQKLFNELRELAQAHAHTKTIDHFLLRRSLPVDIRHNAKIIREKLAAWTEKKIHP